jgi:hypothetical protein
MAYSAWSVVYGEQPSAAKWNILGTNDASFNDGTGIGALAIAGTSLKAQEAWIEVGSGGSAPAFENSWVNYNSGTHQTTAFMKDFFGFVHIKGIVKNGTTAAAIFTLPVGYRPALSVTFATASGDIFAGLGINNAGVVNKTVGGSNAYVALDCLTFKAV